MRPAHVISLCISCFLALSACTEQQNKRRQTTDDGQIEECAPLAYGTQTRVCFSEEAGVVECTKRIRLSAPAGYRIHYTTDGSVPTLKSPVYQRPIALSRKGNRWVGPEASDMMAVKFGGKPFHPVRVSSQLPGANIIRAIAVAPDGSTGAVATRTYFVGTDLTKDFHDVMVISIVTDPDNLLGYDNGILAAGKAFDEWTSSPAADSIDEHNNWWKIGANFTRKGKAWERPASIELFDKSNKLTVRRECGIRLKGRLSRMYSQKSWNISFNGPHGTGSLDYPLFPEAVDANTGGVIMQYRHFSLRNGGNDTEHLKFKDSWIQSRVSGKSFSTQKSRLAVLFLNGEYWGHYNLIEKYDGEFIKHHYGVDDPLIIDKHLVDEGSPSDFHLFEELLSFQDKDLSADSNWKAFKQVMDVQSMADYFATEIYIGNCDWRDTTNTMLWRSVSVDASNPYSDGRWRYMLCDTEFSSGMTYFAETEPEFDSFSAAVREHPLFAAAMKNPEFRDLFQTAIIGVARNNFDAHEVAADLKAWARRWAPYMPYYYERFGDTSWGWQENINSIINFFQQRYDQIIPKVLSFAEP